MPRGATAALSSSILIARLGGAGAGEGTEAAGTAAEAAGEPEATDEAQRDAGVDAGLEGGVPSSVIATIDLTDGQLRTTSKNDERRGRSAITQGNSANVKSS